MSFSFLLLLNTRYKNSLKIFVYRENNASLHMCNHSGTRLFCEYLLDHIIYPHNCCYPDDMTKAASKAAVLKQTTIKNFVNESHERNTCKNLIFSLFFLFYSLFTRRFTKQQQQQTNRRRQQRQQQQ